MSGFASFCGFRFRIQDFMVRATDLNRAPSPCSLQASSTWSTGPGMSDEESAPDIQNFQVEGFEEVGPCSTPASPPGQASSSKP